SADGGRLTLRQALLRVLGIYLNTLPLGLGWALGLAGSRRTLVDRLSGTLAVDTDPIRARRWRFEQQRRARRAASPAPDGSLTGDATPPDAEPSRPTGAPAGAPVEPIVEAGRSTARHPARAELDAAAETRLESRGQPP